MLLSSTRPLLNALAPWAAPTTQVDLKHVAILFAADSIVWTLGLQLCVTLADATNARLQDIVEKRLGQMVQLRELVVHAADVWGSNACAHFSECILPSAVSGSLVGDAFVVAVGKLKT